MTREKGERKSLQSTNTAHEELPKQILKVHPSSERGSCYVIGLSASPSFLCLALSPASYSGADTEPPNA